MVGVVNRKHNMIYDDPNVLPPTASVLFYDCYNLPANPYCRSKELYEHVSSWRANPEKCQCFQVITCKLKRGSRIEYEEFNSLKNEVTEVKIDVVVEPSKISTSADEIIKFTCTNPKTGHEWAIDLMDTSVRIRDRMLYTFARLSHKIVRDEYCDDECFDKYYGIDFVLLQPEYQLDVIVSPIEEYINRNMVETGMSMFSYSPYENDYDYPNKFTFVNHPDDWSFKC